MVIISTLAGSAGASTDGFVELCVRADLTPEVLCVAGVSPADCGAVLEAGSESSAESVALSAAIRDVHEAQMGLRSAQVAAGAAPDMDDAVAANVLEAKAVLSAAIDALGSARRDFRHAALSSLDPVHQTAVDSVVASLSAKVPWRYRCLNLDERGWLGLETDLRIARGCARVGEQVPPDVASRVQNVDTAPCVSESAARLETDLDTIRELFRSGD